MATKSAGAAPRKKKAKSGSAKPRKVLLSQKLTGKKPESIIKVKRPTGHPSLYREEYDEGIIELMSEGASVVEFAASIGVVSDTIYEWASKHESFSAALTRAREACKAWWECQGRKNLIDGYAQGCGTKFNDRLWSKNVSCRFPSDWVEKKADENTAEVIAALDKVLEGVKGELRS
jgi:hypothetical protein